MSRFVLVALVSAVSAIASPPLVPSFSERKIGTPPLGLLEGSQATAPALQPPGSLKALPSLLPPSRLRREVASAPRALSQMPIIVPREDVDYAMRILRPKSGINYTLIVKDPTSPAVR